MKKVDDLHFRGDYVIDKLKEFGEIHPISWVDLEHGAKQTIHLLPVGSGREGGREESCKTTERGSQEGTYSVNRSLTEAGSSLM